MGICQNSITNNESTHFLQILDNQQQKEIKNGQFLEIKTINEPKGFAQFLLLLSDGRLASGSSNGTIQIFNLSTSKKEITLVGHTDTVSSLIELKNGNLVSSSYDGTIIVWRGKKNIFSEYIYSPFSYGKKVFSVINLSGDRMATCSEETKIRILNSNPPYDWITSLSLNLNFFLSIIEQRDKKYLVSSSYLRNLPGIIIEKVLPRDKEFHEHTLCFWNLSTYKCDHAIKLPKSFRTTLLETKNNRILVGYLNIITIVNNLSFQIENIINDASLGTIACFLELRDGRILCGCNQEEEPEKALVYQFDQITYQLIETQNLYQTNRIFSLVALSEKYIISGEFDNIRIWKY